MYQKKSANYTCYKHIELAVSGVLELADENLKQATGNYDPINIVGKGGFGKVFKGLFHSTKIAVTLLNTVRINSPWVQYCFTIITILTSGRSRSHT